MSTATKHFFLKLIPPRPTFAQDMSDNERKIMQEHIAYWNEWMKKGVVLVYGPVFDPNGAYGMGVLQVEDESIIEEIKKNDPSVIAGLNTVEVFSMRAVTQPK